MGFRIESGEVEELAAPGLRRPRPRAARGGARPGRAAVSTDCERAIAVLQGIRDGHDDLSPEHLNRYHSCEADGLKAMASIFFSYTHADEALRDRLEKGLAMLLNEGLIEP